MSDKLAREEVRKVQLTGRASYVISLPKRWVRQVGLEPGDQVEIRLQEDSLVLTPRITRREEKPAEATILVTNADNPQTLVRKIVSLYLVGYEIVHVNSEDGILNSMQVAVVKDTVHNVFMGAEIISESEEEITFQTLLGSTHFSIELAFRRIAVLTSSMSKDIVLALRNLDREKARNVINLDEEINRFSFYIIRQLKNSVHDERLVKRIGLKKQKECLGYRLETKNVESIADSIVNIAERLLRLSGQVAKSSMLQDVSELVSVSNGLFEDVMRAHFRRDFNLAENVISKVFEVERNIDGARRFILDSELDVAEKLELIGIVDNIKQIVNYCKEIAEVLLNRTIEESKTVKVEL